MKTKYYILIFLLVGAIAGFILGSNYHPNCPIDSLTGMPTECMGNLPTYQLIGTIIGAILGIIVGTLFGYLINKKK